VSTTQVLIVCLSALAIVATIAVAYCRENEAALIAGAARDEREARARADERVAAAELERARAAVLRAGPVEGAKVAIHVAGRDVQGTRVRVDDPATVGWIVVDDAAFVTGDRTQPLGGTQWFREGPGMWIQEL
jgi:hypothetical protein